jgi:hypothetical protein
VGWFNQVANLFRRNRVDEELDEELRFHLEARTCANLDAGMNAEEAHHDAKRRLGNATLAKERAHETDIPLSIEAFGRDLRYALRYLRKSPGFSVVVILSLALGIGATTSMFSLIYAVLLHPVPYADWQRLTYPSYLNDDQPGSPEWWFSLDWPQYQ